MEEAQTSFSNFVAGSPLGNKTKLDVDGFATCFKFHLEKIHTSAEFNKMKSELSLATLKMIGDDTEQFIKIFELPSDLSQSDVRDIMKELEELL